MKRILIILDTKEDDERIESVLRNYFKENGEENLIKKIEVTEE